MFLIMTMIFVLRVEYKQEKTRQLLLRLVEMFGLELIQLFFGEQQLEIIVLLVLGVL